MSSDERLEWTAEDQEMLDRLPRERMPDPAIEDRIVALLSQDRRIGPRRNRTSQVRVAIAAAIVAFIAGLLVGRASLPADTGPARAATGTDSAESVVTYYVGM